jgi:ketosteroid isomerase-like protein
MSQENVERYRRGIDAFNRRDIEAFMASYDPEVVAVSRILAVEGGTYRGHDGIRRWWKDLLDVFPDFTIEIISVRDAGNSLVAGLRNRAHGEGSDAPFEETMWQVVEVRDGTVVRWQMYGSEEEALEAAGLSE